MLIIIIMTRLMGCLDFLPIPFLVHNLHQTSDVLFHVSESLTNASQEKSKRGYCDDDYGEMIIVSKTSNSNQTRNSSHC